MKFSVRYFIEPKLGSHPHECEDYCHPPRNKEKIEAVSYLCFAISDGASESFLSKHWARILVRIFCHPKQAHPEGIHLDFNIFYKEALSEWESWKSDYLKKRNKRNRPIQWYEEPGLEAGAAATFLGLLVSQEGKWRAYAFGDSCLFHIRDNKLIKSFPISSNSLFNNSPRLLPSSPKKKSNITNWDCYLEEEWKSGDFFYLATDAFSQWFLEETENNGEPWNIVNENIDNLKNWLSRLREGKKIRNDDVALLRIVVE